MSDPDRVNTLDINASFRGGGRSVEWLKEINKTIIVKRLCDESAEITASIAATHSG